ncbi:MAG TPA: MgtC/SapB family protein [Rhizomicrobium sp.]
MSVHISTLDIVWRLLAAMLAGGIIGYDRGTRGRIAGLRTTILMCLAATAAMIEANLMLSVTGKTAESFTNMDALRFPLGILSGIGFIGAGAIVRRGRLVTGVTTAATLWLVTVIGLVLGAGYLGLGAALTALAFAVLTILKQVEPRLFREHHASLRLKASLDGPSSEELQRRIVESGFVISTLAVAYGELLEIDCRVAWDSAKGQEEPPAFLEPLSRLQGMKLVAWQPINAGLLEE